MKKNIVIISYCTFPMNTPRAIRTHELSKELAREGHSVTLYVLTGSYNYSKTKTNNLYIKSLGTPRFFKFDPRQTTQFNIMTKIIHKLIGKYIEFPMIELVPLVYNALKSEKDIDLLITIASPHALHWGTAVFKVLNKESFKNTIWIADCGDPYMGNPNFTKPKYFKYIEKFFCKQADFISVPTIESISAYYEEFHNKIKIITQGFKFPDLELNNYRKNSIPTFIYAGRFHPVIRNPIPFLEYLTSINKDFRFVIYTDQKSILMPYKKKLGKKLEVKSMVPREDLIGILSQAEFLINFENISSVQTPSKLIDYSIAKRPILSIDTNKDINFSLIDDFLSGFYDGKLILENLDMYKIESVSQSFLGLINTDSHID